MRARVGVWRMRRSCRCQQNFHRAAPAAAAAAAAAARTPDEVTSFVMRNIVKDVRGSESNCEQDSREM
jgi:hypothetical protein